jgi:adenylate cyclase
MSGSGGVAVQTNGGDHEPMPAPLPGERRVAAIVAADVVGYTRLMEADESGIHARLMHVRTTFVLPAIERHHGRLIKNTGDGFLAMFDDAPAALQAAMDMQRSTMTFEADRDPSRRIAFRMGINVADVIVEDHDVYGDGVNIAARLQTHAEPHGIVISGLVAEAAGGTLGMQAVDLGQMYLRNRAQPVRVLSLRFADAPRRSIGEAEPGSEGRPTIAVLPFRRGTVAEDSYFADGIVDNIIHSLAALKDLFVIARGSTLGFGGGDIDARAIGQALGVRYLLYGSAQKIGNRVRISTELLDTETAAAIGTAQYDERFEDIFELQDRIATHVVKAIAPRVRDSELRRTMRKHPQNMTAYDLVLQALELLYRFDYAGFSRARGLLQRAMVVDANYSLAPALAARWHMIRVGQGWSPDISDDTKEASRLAQFSIEFDPNNSLALAIYGHLRSFLYRDIDSGMAHLERALTSSPNNELAWAYSSVSYSYIGDGTEAVHRADKALRLSPADQTIYFTYSVLCLAHYVNGSYTEAVEWGRRAMAANPAYTAALRYLAAALSAAGLDTQAREAGRLLMEREPEFSLTRYASSRLPFRLEIQREHHLQRLREAGLPE